MAKIDLTRELYNRGHKLKDVKAILADIADIAARAAKNGDELTIPKVVTIRVSNRAPRIYHNPHTGEKIEKGPHKVVVASLTHHMKTLNLE